MVSERRETLRSQFLEEAVTRYAQYVELALPFVEPRYGLTIDTLNEFRMGVVCDPFPAHAGMHMRFVIPYLDASGSPRALKFRCLQHEDCKLANCVKYLGEESTEPRLYNVRALVDDAAETLYVTEGELDCAVLTQIGLTAVAYPGTGSWRPEFTRAIGPDWNRIVVVADGDDAGEAAAKKVAKLVRGEVISMPAGHDVSSLYVKGGIGALADVLGLDLETTPSGDELDERYPEEPPW